jgi:DNA-binding SARP family transcriptional activator/WD40 repeat protein
VEYRVLGPISATLSGRPIHLGGRRQKLILAMLLARPGRVLSQEYLVESVWGQVTPGAIRSFHTYISSLRKLVNGAVERRGGGYSLVADPGTVDSERFLALLGAAEAEMDPYKARQLLLDGLSLWQGPAFGDLGDEPTLIDVASQLDQKRLAAYERRFELEVALGGAAEIIPEIEQILDEDPYRESLIALHMLALYRVGRQADSLRVYHRASGRLIEELGVDPSPDLQELELKILSHDPELTSGHSTTYPSGPVAARGYELHGSSGASPFGRRRRGFHHVTGREVSILMVDDEMRSSLEFIRLFESEMQHASVLSHPHLFPILDYWHDPDRTCVVTPYPASGTLDDVVALAPLSITETVKVVDQIGSALGSVHRAGQVHGALSPSTVVVDAENNYYLTDLGLSRSTGGGTRTDKDDIAALGQLFVFSLGADATADTSVISPTLEHALARAVHPDPKLRYERAEDLLRAIRQSLGFDVVPIPDHIIPSRATTNPYKGLRAFQEPDAPDFHGRDDLVGEVLRALADVHLVTVVGPSGSGKSSAVRAGVLPALRRGEIAGSDLWLITDMYPGEHPIEALGSALLRVARWPSDDLRSKLLSTPEGLTNAVEGILGERSAEILVVIDQFEEVFARVRSEDEIRAFLHLLTSSTDPSSRVRILATLRADFFDRPLRYTGFAEVFGAGIVTVHPPTRDGLSRAISRPAIDRGTVIDPALVSRMIADVIDQPGGLPLLQFTLTELFERRAGGRLSVRQYEQLGGVGGALVNTAEAIYQDLSAKGRETTKQVFLRLVSVDEFGDDTRRRVRQSAILDLPIEETVLTDVLQRFGASRFLAFDRDPATSDPTVELAHEALLREWRRLRTWVDERREDLVTHRRLQVACEDWVSHDRSDAYLLRGGLLDLVRSWEATTDLAVSLGERDLIESSIALAEAERREREQLEAKAAARRRALLATLVSAALIATMMGGYALVQRGSAVDNARDAFIRELTQASLNIKADDPVLSVLLAGEAVDRARAAGLSPPPETLGALWSAHLEQRVLTRFEDLGQQAIAFDPTGGILAVDAARSEGVPGIIILDWIEGTEVTRIELSGTEPVLSVAYSPDGAFLAAARLGGSDGEALIDVFATDGWQHLHQFSGEPWAYSWVSFGDDGTILGLGWDELDVGSLTTWDPRTGEQLSHVPNVGLLAGGVAHGYRADFVAGTHHVPVGVSYEDTGENAVVVVDMDEGVVVETVDVELTPWAVAVAPDGSMLAASDYVEQSVIVLDSETGQVIAGPITHQDPQALEWSPDGTRLAVSGNESDVTLIDVSTGEQEILSGHQASVYSASFHPARDLVATASVDGEVRVWNSSPASGETWKAGSEDDVSQVAATTESIVLSITGKGIEVVDAETKEIVSSVAAVTRVPTFAAVARQSGNYAMVDEAGHASIRESDGSLVSELPDCSEPRALSPDGRYVIVDFEPAVFGPCDHALRLSGVYDTLNRRTITDHGETHVRYGAISPVTEFDGAQYAAVTLFENDNSVVEVWALDPVERIASIGQELVADLPQLLLAFSPSGRYLGMGTNGPRSVVVDVQALAARKPVTDAIVFNKETHTGNAPQTKVTDAGLVATSGFDGFYRWWDLISGDLVFEIEVAGLRGHPAQDFIPDGSFYFYEDGDGVVRRIPTDLDALIDQARSSAIRDFSEDECRRYLHQDGCTGD